jgi:hypothetical protein
MNSSGKRRIKNDASLFSCEYRPWPIMQRIPRTRDLITVSVMKNMLARKPARRRSNRSYRKTSWRHFYLCWRRIAGKSVYNFLHWGSWQKKTLSIWASCGIFIEKTDEISRTLHAQNPSKWRVRYDRCQRRVADKTCRFLVSFGQYKPFAYG